MLQQYEVTVILHVSLVTTVPVPARSATQARALLKEQWNALGASLAYVSVSETYAWDVFASRMAIAAVAPMEETPPSPSPSPSG
jgi:hypothetical protein